MLEPTTDFRHLKWNVMRERMDVILGQHAWDPYRRIGRMKELIGRNCVCGLVVKGIQLRMLNRARDALPIFQSTCAFHERLLLTRMPRSSIVAMAQLVPGLGGIDAYCQNKGLGFSAEETSSYSSRTSLLEC